MKRSPDVIPFNKAYIAGRELFHVAKAVVDGDIKGGGLFTDHCEQWIERNCDVQRALLTNSCSAALEMSALLAEIQAGDEVILPSFTFTSTANAFLLRGAKLVFVDIRPDTLNIDERLLAERITNKTKAIVVMHYAGVACEMDTIMDLAQAHSLLVIEDAAHAILARYKDKPLGSIGQLATFSFHETKNFSAGEGGALLINNPAFAERAEILLEKGTNRKQFFRGEVDKYSWVDIGGSYLPSEIIAAFLYGQLECAMDLYDKRMNLWQRYYDALAPLAAQSGIRLPTIPSECTHNAHLFYLLMPNHDAQQALLQHCHKNKVYAVFHYIPLHSSPQGREIHGNMPLPVTESTSDCIVRLPLFYSITNSEQEKVIDVIQTFLMNHEY